MSCSFNSKSNRWRNKETGRFIKCPTANSSNDPTASIKNTTMDKNYRTDGTWGEFKRDKNAAHIPL
ncbi:hypothetical protein [Gilliamella sp. Pas-s25]|uniref:hypothetical protein n=1 Tax=Gilliamella sp. Pas-s25 TaxID=2687310 RepID=UPI00135D5070|nr:hypothetical protein [Gilliamella sp. Pas-s25]MWP61177.1 hypothetical protein [Gilliamella sp. Pas-s25]